MGRWFALKKIKLPAWILTVVSPNVNGGEEIIAHPSHYLVPVCFCGSSVLNRQHFRKINGLMDVPFIRENYHWINWAKQSRPHDFSPNVIIIVCERVGGSTHIFQWSLSLWTSYQWELNDTRECVQVQWFNFPQRCKRYPCIQIKECASLGFS